MRRPARYTIAVTVVALFAASCSATSDIRDGAVGSEATSGGSSVPASTGSPGAANELSVAPASFDLSVGDDRRFLAGVFTPDKGLVIGGEVEMSFFFLGDEQGAQEQELVATTTASYLPVPGLDSPEGLSEPQLADKPTATGVYETTTSFDRPGFWAVGVAAELDGETYQGTGTFEVLEQPVVVSVGSDAPASDNLTLDSDVAATAVDSRAGDGGMADVPDPQLHDSTVADAIDAQRPVVVALTTPVYCVSRFCGPITDTVEELEAEYGDRAEFIHLEVWRSFDDNELNPAAAEWIQTDAGGNEPWVFLVGADGTIQARWDNVLNLDELTDKLDALPA